jgi:hypothetical protein
MRGLRTRCCGEYLDLRGVRQWEAGENCIIITSTSHQVLLVSANQETEYVAGIREKCLQNAGRKPEGEYH